MPRRFVRVASADDFEPTDEAKRILRESLLNREGWSIFEATEQVSPLRVVAAFYAKRSGPQLRDFLYVQFSEADLRSMGITNFKNTLPFEPQDYPEDVRVLHHDLFPTSQQADQIMSQFQSKCAKLDHQAVIAEQAQIHNCSTVSNRTKKNVRKRIENLASADPRFVVLQKSLT